MGFSRISLVGVAMLFLVSALPAFAKSSAYATYKTPKTYSPSSAYSSGSNSVRGYSKRDGTYVAPHYRTNPNTTQRDNWSSRPNVNPYTGKSGTKEPIR